MTLIQTEPKSIKLGPKITDMQGPCPSGFHVPLNTEWQAVYDIWTALGGGSSDGTNFGIALKLPFAGSRSRGDAGVIGQGLVGDYWSSARKDEDYSYGFYFLSSNIDPQNYYFRSLGFSVRCFRNSPIIPTSSWTKLYGTSIEAGGIFWSSADGLISLSSDGSTRITIADKNLGATTVWNNGNALSQSNCGYYYQRGNNYGFPRTGSVTTSSTQVNASTYGPGNYYYSSTFITRSSSPYGWDSSDNGNLRGGVSGAEKDIKKVYLGSNQVRPGLITTAGIYHNAGLGLISLSSDGSTRITISDKNLGATTVWNNGDTLSQANCGKYYQRGNNYGFPFTGSVTTSSTKVNASTYGPGNYYNSSTFITASTGGWDSSKNRNLWGEITNTLVARQGPCVSGYHVPTNSELTSLKTIWVALGGGANDGTNFGATLKIPFAGYRYPSPGGQGNNSFYWGSYNSGNGGATNLSLGSSTIEPANDNFTDAGYSIRPFKNEPVQPQEGGAWTKLNS